MERHIIILILLLPLVKQSIGRRADVKDDSSFRLPLNLIPNNYTISLFLDPDYDIFAGTVYISFHLLAEDTSVELVYLHADLEYITLETVKLNNERACTYIGSNASNIVEISCGSITKYDNYLYIEYNGTFSGDAYGLVKTYYQEDLKQQVLINSYFEPTYARRAFPCFDEPELKASFSLEVIYPENYTVLSSTVSKQTNTNVLNKFKKFADSADDKVYYVISFEPTPKIPTYLFSVFVSKLKEVNYLSANEEYSFRIVARPSVLNMTSKVAGVYHQQIMENLEGLVGQTFQDLGDPECYQIAVPDCYSENMGVGLFAYRERDLLDEGDKTTVKATKNILQAMTYKISHEWFGGEVTSEWWSDAWANEALPLYLKYLIPSEIEEDYEFMDHFVLEVKQRSMQYDALPFAESISSKEWHVNSKWDIANKFEHHSFLKGASLLHMINHSWSSPDQFKTNIQYHLQNRTIFETNGKDVLKHLTIDDGAEDLYAHYYEWAFTEGFPLLNVKINHTISTEDIEYITISQKRFTYPVDNTTTSEDLSWTIPITTSTASSNNMDTFFKPDIDLLINITKDDWIVFNTKGTFHYRVNYEEELWRRIIRALKSNARTEFHPLTRAQLIDDIFSIARTGDVGYSLAFELADYLVHETEYAPWYSAFNAFSYLLSSNSYIAKNLKPYILNLMKNVIEIPDAGITNQENKTHVEVLKQSLILEWACKLGHSSCINYTTTEFEGYVTGKSDIQDYNLRPVILCNGIRYSTTLASYWNTLFNRVLRISSAQEKIDILYALSCTEDQSTLFAYLVKLIATTKDIKRQDVLFVFESVISNSVGADQAMTFFDKCLDLFVSAYEGDSGPLHILSDVVYALAEKLFADNDLEWLENFLTEGIFYYYEDLKTRSMAVATINNNWIKQYQADINSILTAVTTTGTTSNSSPTTEMTKSSTEATTSEPGTTTESSGEGLFISQILVLICTLYTQFFCYLL